MKQKKFLQLLGVLVVIVGAVATINPVYAVFNGRLVGNQEALTEGMVQVWGGLFGPCSGTLLTNNWAITCNHAGMSLVPVENIKVYFGNITSTNFSATADFVIGHPSLDFTLVHFKAPFLINGNLFSYKRGLFTGTTADLANRVLNHIGWGGNWNYKAALVTATGAFDDYNFAVAYQPGQASEPGDSGSPLFTSSITTNNVLTGVDKNGYFGRPENFRDWALSYLYNRPIDLPKVWYLPYTDQCRINNYCKLWETPFIQNNFQNLAAFSPCPGGSFTWNVSYNLEAGADFIYIWSDNTPSSTLTGVGTKSGSGQGRLYLEVKTNGANQSIGITKMTYACLHPALPGPLEEKFVSQWPNPLPANYNSTDSFNACKYSNDSRSGYDLKIEYQFAPGDYGKVIYYSDGGMIKTDYLGNTSTRFYNTHVRYGAAAFEVHTAPGGVSPSGTPITISKSEGIVAAGATCDLKFVCHGPECFTIPEKLPAKMESLTDYWDPCRGRSFKWQASYDFAPGHSVFTIQPADNQGGQIVSLTGNNTSQWYGASGGQKIQIFTDGLTQGDGLRSLKAMCNDW